MFLELAVTTHQCLVFFCNLLSAKAALRTVNIVRSPIADVSMHMVLPVELLKCN
jgi:hypothetical protein